jgi:hypothetical protein
MHRVGPVVLSCVVALALGAGCREEGAVEKAGKKLDRALEKLAHPNEGPLERAGRKTDEALEEARRALEEAGERD